MSGLIDDHAWRPPVGNGRTRGMPDLLDRPCEYMNCRRPRAEHVRVTS